MVLQDVEKIKQAFGDREFSGKDVARVLELKTWHGSGAMLKWLRRRNMVYATRNGYRFGTPSAAPASIQSDSTPVADQTACILPPLVRIGEFYLSDKMLLIVHTGNQEGSPALRFYTTILEIDPATKHPRNKIINFVKSRDPREYAQAAAWLDSMAGTPHAVDETALELAAELEQKLNAANQEIASLKAKIEAIRGAL